MAFDFEKAAGKAKSKRIAAAKGARRAPKAAKAEPNEAATDYQGRAKAEAKRFKLAACDDFWAAICFKTPAECEEFMELTGFSPVTFGDDAAELLVRVMPEVNRRTRPAVVRGAIRYPYTFKGVAYTHNLEADCKLEAAALVEAIRSRKDRPSYRAASDSPYYVSLVCRDDDDRSALYDRFGLWRYGAGYLDGSAWLARIKAAD